LQYDATIKLMRFQSVGINATLEFTIAWSTQQEYHPVPSRLSDSRRVGPQGIVQLIHSEDPGSSNLLGWAIGLISFGAVFGAGLIVRAIRYP